MEPTTRIPPAAPPPAADAPRPSAAVRPHPCPSGSGSASSCFALPPFAASLVRACPNLEEADGSRSWDLEEVVDDIFQLREPPRTLLHALAAPPRLCSKLLQLLQKHHPLDYAEEFAGQKAAQGSPDAADVQRHSEAAARLVSSSVPVTKETNDARTIVHGGSVDGEAREPQDGGAECADSETTEDVSTFVPWWKREGRRVALHFLKRCRKTTKGGPVLLLLGTTPERVDSEILELLRTCPAPAPPPLPALRLTACQCLPSSASLEDDEAQESPPSSCPSTACPGQSVPSSDGEAAGGSAPVSSFFVHVSVPSVPPVTPEQQRVWGEIWPCYLNKTKPNGPRRDAGAEETADQPARDGEAASEQRDKKDALGASASVRQELLLPLELSTGEKATHQFFLNAAMEISRREGRSACIITYAPSDPEETPRKTLYPPPPRKRLRARSEGDNTAGERTKTKGEFGDEVKTAKSYAKREASAEDVSALRAQCREPAAKTLACSPQAADIASDSIRKRVFNGCEATFCSLAHRTPAAVRDSGDLERDVADAFRVFIESRASLFETSRGDEFGRLQTELGNATLPKVVAACVDHTRARAPLDHAAMRAIGVVGEKLLRKFASREGACGAGGSSEAKPGDGSRSTQIKLLLESVKGDSHDVSQGNYYCHGCVVYCSHEPCVMCAMALVHSRIKLLIFGRTNHLHGGITRGRLHLDRRLNHGYRVLRAAVRETASTQDDDGR
ncbi:cytidine and deoxycytidylate deaminase zinc-binding region domain-containing protein [Besnoitia besnoiti]|uniref:Cytidine and deoxycytidylate deaminase zinc-binding region domain-containing protein n=1 Tax=Besnoitia besnoiti TaxID=94643 RepID=A0A2A9MGA6_BESBE|nr:cytidine and deoxycytidylate deaminase zinc-binding region domain-containing protein [Besnoitia besnoiti]PFH36949.1 cytidine and deoxycytidylate deaminase zinc-binding region domain-containing protein [Besnoitia besnoiti]